MSGHNGLPPGYPPGPRVKIEHMSERETPRHDRQELYDAIHRKVKRMSDPVMTRHAVVLTALLGTGTEGQLFVTEPDDETGAVAETYFMSLQDWTDMGKPRAITLTVEPGDLLNG